METYETKDNQYKPAAAHNNKPVPIKDDFFDKMMQDNQMGNTFYKKEQ